MASLLFVWLRIVSTPRTQGTFLEKYIYLRNGEKCKTHKIDCCERGLQLEDIATKNVSENDLNTRMKYTMARIEN